jgi:hypothetical protein
VLQKRFAAVTEFVVNIARNKVRAINCNKPGSCSFIVLILPNNNLFQLIFMSGHAQYASRLGKQGAAQKFAGFGHNSVKIARHSRRGGCTLPDHRGFGAVSGQDNRSGFGEF